MITKGTAWLGRLRRLLSRSEWAVRLLQLPRCTADKGAPGLVLVQIDGLSRRQLESAIAQGRMPFLRRLLQREQYRLATMYSGIPSSTPSVQGELFYGVRCATPAFSYFSHALGREVAMAEPAAAEQVEGVISEKRDGVLSGGASYCNVYSGGAAESHFCAANLGFGGFLRSVSLARLLVVATWYAWSLARAVGLTLLEVLLAIIGFVRGTLRGGEFLQELRFIPARVAIVVLLRELVTIGASLDVARGVRIVHLNLLGYDEQAHRRGPDSAFAHWTLKGIDRTIKTLWLAAHRSTARDYGVWVYSDHGQETTTPYEQACGQSISEAVAKAASDLALTTHSEPTQPTTPRASERAAWISRRWMGRYLLGVNSDKATGECRSLRIVANGPLGLVYFPERPEPEALLRFAQRMVDDNRCPLVLAPTTDGVVAVDENGRHTLPRDSVEVLGEEHPFREEVAEDLVRLVKHPDTGDVVLCGWNKRGESLSFPQQHGAHAGPGTQETAAFLMTPIDAPMPASTKAYYRPEDLRQGVLRHFERPKQLRPSRRHESLVNDSSIRVMTYNVHACVGMDNQLSVERVARVIDRAQPHIVALQELDVARSRSGGVDQARAIAHYLEMMHHFHPAWVIEEEQYGDALLSRYPMRLVKTGTLVEEDSRGGEPRGALWVEVLTPDGPLQVINTHLAVSPQRRNKQLTRLLGGEWLQAAVRKGHTLLCGDFNLGPLSPQYKRLCEHLVDVQCTAPAHRRAPRARPQPTWASWRPISRIDHLLVTPSVGVIDVQVLGNHLARHASDHLPLVADLTIVPTAHALQPLVQHQTLPSAHDMGSKP